MVARKGPYKILLTGGAGFIGSHVADLYLHTGHSVILVDNLSAGLKKNIPPGAKFYPVDICDLKALEKIFKRETPDIVNHHAAQIDVRLSVENPQKDLQTNIAGTLNLLQLMGKYKMKKILYAGTGGALYGETSNHPSRETDPIHPTSPYGLSKYCAEHYIRLYAKLYGFHFTILRYGNVYGPRQNPYGEAGVVAIFIHSLLKGETPRIYGNGRQLRDYVYVEDVAKANLNALGRGEDQTVNIATGKTISVNQLCQYLKEMTGFKGKVVYKPKREGEIFSSRLNATLARRTIGWTAKIPLKEGLKKTVAWHEVEKRGVIKS